MQPTVVEMLREWHDFYVLVGTASATLVGLMFVSASIGVNVYNETHIGAMKSFVTPTVVLFASAMFICIVVTVPTHTWMTLAGVLGAGGALGLVYSGNILVSLVVRHNFKVDLEDRMYYALTPVIGYALVVATAVMLFRQSHQSLNVMAAALLVLLLAGIRNAWDMTLWIVLKTPDTAGPPQMPDSPGPPP
jgi:hypothetical protein